MLLAFWDSKIITKDATILNIYNVCLQPLLHEGLSEPEFFVDFVYKFLRLLEKLNFSWNFERLSLVTRR